MLSRSLVQIVRIDVLPAGAAGIMRIAALAPALTLVFVAACEAGAPGAATPSGDVAAEPPAIQREADWRVATPDGVNSLFDCLAGTSASIVSAHRGGPAPGFPENAIETLAETLRKSPAIMEVDVGASSDGVLFLLHDDGLDRTTTGSGPAAQATWEQLSTLRLVDNTGQETAFSIPRFADALAWAEGKTVLQVDFKRSAPYEDVVAEVKRQGAEDRVIFIAYSLAQARRLHRLAPDVMISLDMASQSELNEAVASGIPADRLIAFTGTEEPQPRLNETLASSGVEAIFGTLGGARSIDNNISDFGGEDYYAELAGMGVDVIATDRPAAAHAALEAAGRAVEAGECGVARG
jgi:glycerophosphoryl diester phosphodiesterase